MTHHQPSTDHRATARVAVVPAASSEAAFVVLGVGLLITLLLLLL